MSVASDIYISPEDEPPVSSNPFAHIPYDVLQYVLNKYLTPNDRFNFNQVLEPQERIYRRFPKDYALSHQLGVSRLLWNSMRTRTNYNIEKSTDYSGFTKDPERYAVIATDYILALFRYAVIATDSILALFNFFKEPKNQLTLRFIKGRKEDYLNSMAIYSGNDSLLYDMPLAPKIITNIRKQAQITCDLIASIPFERHVPIEKYRR